MNILGRVIDTGIVRSASNLDDFTKRLLPVEELPYLAAQIV